MTYVVTGCAGFIGSHVCDALLARGERVVGIDLFTGHYPRAAKEANLARAAASPGFRLVEGDLCARDLDEIVAGADAIVHLAAQPGVRGSWGAAFPVYARDNVVASQAVFEAATRRGARVVWASSSSVYGDAEAHPTPEDAAPRPISPYGVTKLACESMAAAYRASRGLDHVGLRCFTVYGPRQRPDMAFARIARAALEGRGFTVHGTGEQTRDVTHVDDAVAATLAALERGRAGAVYNIGGGDEVSVARAIRTAEALTGRPIDVTHASAQPGDARRTCADTSRARADLGWSPRVAFEDGFAGQIAWAAARLAARAPAASGQ